MQKSQTTLNTTAFPNQEIYQCCPKRYVWFSNIFRALWSFQYRFLTIPLFYSTYEFANTQSKRYINTISEQAAEIDTTHIHTLLTHSANCTHTHSHTRRALDKIYLVILWVILVYLYYMTYALFTCVPIAIYEQQLWCSKRYFRLVNERKTDL